MYFKDLPIFFSLVKYFENLKPLIIAILKFLRKQVMVRRNSWPMRKFAIRKNKYPKRSDAKVKHSWKRFILLQLLTDYMDSKHDFRYINLFLQKSHNSSKFISLGRNNLFLLTVIIFIFFLHKVKKRNK